MLSCFFPRPQQNLPPVNMPTNENIESWINALTKYKYYTTFANNFNEHHRNTRYRWLAFTPHVYSVGFCHRMMRNPQEPWSNLREPWKELLEFLNEIGVGNNKKSLKFEVLVKLFDLDPAGYTNANATQLIDMTHQYLLRLHQTKMLQNPGFHTEPELNPANAKKEMGYFPK